MIIQLIEVLYTYISNFICPYLTPTSKSVSFNIDIVGEAINPPLNHTIDRDNIDKSFKKSHSYSATNYYCGFCSKYINIPIHMYCDKPFCSINCRKNQYQIDHSTNIVREHHSFSV